MMGDFCPFMNTLYQLRDDTKFKLRNTRTMPFDTGTPSFFGILLLRNPQKIEAPSSLDELLKKIAVCIQETCPCEMCKTYVHKVFRHI